MERAPRFVRAVDAARQRGGDAKTRLRSFRGDPFLLYAALWYAADEGVAVIVAP